MYEKGEVVRVARGLYRYAEAPSTENFTVAAVAKKIPHSIICLLTALRIHGIGTQEPGAVWIALDFKARKPQVKDLPIRVVRFSGKSGRVGIRKKMIDGIETRITDPARTVVDCFRYRNKIGLDVALEALRDTLRTGKATRQEIRDTANQLRAGSIIRPYMEGLSI